MHDPATGEVLATLASATSEDALAALDAADKAQASWARTAPRERAEILRRAFDLVTERAEDFALLMTLEMGKPLAEARGEVTYGAEFLRWFSEETVRDYGRYLTTPEGKNKILVQHKPVGPCLLITPWNFPLAMATRKVAPAIAAGCTMVLKPAKLTPLTAQLFAQTMLDAGLPAGVLNVVSSASASGISGPLLADPRLRKVSFTGSTPVGKRLMADAAQNVLRTSMELGGNAPFIVFEDADLDKAVEGAMAAKMRNMGEACTAANRFLVQESVAEEFTAKFAAAMGALTTGRGTEPGTQVGPLIDAGARDDVHALVSRRRRRRSHRRHRRRTGGRARLLLPAHRARQRAQRRRNPAARKFSARSPRSPPSPPRRTPSGWRTPANTAWPPTSTAATSTGCCAWPSRSNSAWWASTPASSPTPRHPSAGSSSPGSAAKAAPKASPNTPPRSTSASPTPTPSSPARPCPARPGRPARDHPVG